MSVDPTQDHTLFKKKGRTECPPEARCLNCMPKPGKEDDYECWAIKKPIMYKVCRLQFVKARQTGLAWLASD
jgi:hypothetical protein